MGFSEGNVVAMGLSVRSVIIVSAVFLSACPDVSGPDAAAPFDAGEPDAAIIDAGPPLPLTLEPGVVAIARDGGGVEVKAGAQLEDVATLSVSLPVRLKDFRVRLMDWRDQIVPSDDELLADGKTYVITLQEPLKTGRGYALKLDAELGPIVTDETGATWNDWDLSFRIAGDVVPDPKPTKQSGKRKR